MSEQPRNEFAAIDLGSNSFHMVIAREDAGQLRLIDRLREPVSLGSGLDTEKRLTPDVQTRALECLAGFGQRLRGVPPANVRAVGTKTLRRAINAQSFLADAEQALVLSIDVIPGNEEARLIYLGVRASGELIGDPPFLILDIGGGSTEIAVGTGNQPSHTESISAGCVSATQKHFADGQITSEKWQAAVQDAQIELRPLKRTLQKSAWQSVIGSSGSIKAIAGQLKRSGTGDGDVITRKGLNALRETLLSAGTLNAKDFDALSDARRRVFAGGCAVLDAMFRSLAIQSMSVSHSALREGVLYELFGHTEDNVQHHTVESMQRRFGIDPEQAQRVADAIETVRTRSKGDWSFSATQRRLIQHAALLHEIGLSISHSQYHKHGEMLINHADMPGFSHLEQAQLATLVRLQRRRFHPKLIPDTLKQETDSLIRMALLLRIGLIVSRDRQAMEIDKLTMATAGSSIRLSAPAAWFQDHPLTQKELLREAEFASSAGLSLHIESA